MKLSNQTVNILVNILEKFIKQKRIKNYVITISLSSRIEVKLCVSKEDNNLIDDIFKTEEANVYDDAFRLIDYQNIIDIDLISEEEESEESIKLIFETNGTKPHLNYNLRRRFHDLLNLQSHTEKNPCPVVTFYSYKGGVGRTTALTCYAQYLANRGKEVIIIDCDFEAPGFTNYFGYRFGNETQAKYGVVEYLLDRQFLLPQGQTSIQEKLITKLASEYSYQVGKSYLSEGTKGKIRVIKAGNYESANIDNYLEGLARLDIGNIALFQDFLGDLQKGFGLTRENSVILIDSRTGFNDTFATLCSISNLVVGVFGTNTQSQTGLQYILDSFLAKPITESSNSTNKSFLFIQSFSANTSNRNELWEIAENYLIDNSIRFGIDKHGVPYKSNFYYFPKSDDIAKIGESNISEKQEVEFYQFIEEDRPAAITKLFEAIDSYLLPTKTANNSITNIVENSTTQENTTTTHSQTNNPYIELLNSIKIPEIRAENITKNQKKKDFYLREKLVDIFNWDKYIISGSKGTGKTFIYECMEIPLFQEALSGEANVEHENYFFVNIMPVLDGVEKGKKEKFFYASNLVTYEDKDKNFYQKFWTVYIAHKIFKHSSIKNFIADKKLSISWNFEFVTTKDYVNKLWAVISNDEKYLQVEQDLLTLNNLLAKSNKGLIFCFDQLDHFVEPNKWDTWIYELVRLWRANPYSHLFPKIFLRSDLIRSKFVKGVNSTEIFKSSISLEWTKEELFAYFFGAQLNKKDVLYNFFQQKGINENLISKLDEWIEYSRQIPTQREYLEPLVNVFFGKSSDRDNNANHQEYDSPYNWFGYNLKDGNNDLSIRPFIWLLEKAKNMANTEIDSYLGYAEQTQSILGAKYFAAYQAMEYAGEKYYDELEREQGNELLRIFREFLRKTRKINRWGTYELSKFQELLSIFLREKETELRSLGFTNIQDISTFLERNGIVRERRMKGGQLTKYEVPFLYKYYLLFDNK